MLNFLAPNNQIALTKKPCIAKNERGIVLFMALIILVAMSLAGVALVRSVDTSNVIAGNLSFRQSTLLATDGGIQTAYAWLRNAQQLKLLQNTDIGNGYFSNIPAAEPDWQANATWTNAVKYTDANGNQVQYLIHRMCEVANTAPADTETPGLLNKCATTKAYLGDISVTGKGNDGDPQGFDPAQQESFFYRVTTRVIGPRNTISIAQATMTFDR